MTEQRRGRVVHRRLERLREVPQFRVQGRVTRIVGTVVEASAIDVAVGDLCLVARARALPVDAEVVGFNERGIQLMPLGDLTGINPGAAVWHAARVAGVGVGPALLGRIIDGLGRPLDEGGPVEQERRVSIDTPPPHPLARTPITAPLGVGIRAIDALLTLGRGQRIGVFSGSGVGKSVLMGMIARNTAADVNVIALLGERGREVREFIDRDLGPEGLRRSIVVVATSDQAALIRAKGALVATAIAEYFRSLGQHVLLMVDSITRVGMAWREIGLSTGEPPTTKGYPPSLFPRLARLLERAGTGERGSITGLYTVLVESDDFNEPLADTARSILDGHIVLTRQLASEQHYPAIDVLQSVSRVRDRVIDADHHAAASTLLRLESSYRSHEDLISVGAYKSGTDPDADVAIALRPHMLDFLRQEPSEAATFASARDGLVRLAEQSRQVRAAP